MNRTNYNGDLRIEHVGNKVELVGWVAKRRNFGSINFIDLRDRTGIVQLVGNQDEIATINELKNEYVIKVVGTLRERQDKNPKMLTGDVEVDIESVEIINKAETTPLIIADETDALEDTRLKYRYLDLRRPVMQKRLIDRFKIVSSMRHTLEDHGFIEVETPMLTKSTPEGAREYLVPSRVHPGEFYALAQSPQIFKQMLMIGGLERYYQIARCFRDEDLRSDRQLDFTQVDIEASFLNQDEFMEIMEEIVNNVMKNVLGEEKPEIVRIPFQDALNNYGSDKPDMRFDMQLQDFQEIFAQSEFKVFQEAATIKGIVLKKEAESVTRKKIDSYTDLVKKHGLMGLVVLKYVDGTLNGSAAKFISETELNTMVEELGLEEGDVIFIGCGEWEVNCTAIGALRLALAKEYKLIPKDVFKYAWVIDFPMFEMEEGVIIARHHPFTSPQLSDIELLDTDPLAVKAQAYDLVLNGYEVAGGSMRIYSQELQQKIFEMIGFTKEEIEKRFGFFVDAFKYGTPPHGGMAFGLDRYAMALTQSDSIRDVIAFPKVASARDPLTNAPSLATDKQLDELHLIIQDED